jgi:competence protein ComEC
MTRNGWIVFCLAYLIGLLSTNLYPFPSSGFDWQQLGIIATVLMGLAVLVAIVTSRWLKFSYNLCFGAGIVAILAVVYFQLRVPQPDVDDISYLVKEDSSQFVTVGGKVLDEPRLTEDERAKFWLQAKEIGNKEKVSGKLYVTVPPLSAMGIYPGEYLQVKGILYLPTPPRNPGGFDFQTYLAKEGAFVGLKGLEVVDYPDEPLWGWWKLRRRIVRSQLQGLGSPYGQLVSSMVLGRKAVDLPQAMGYNFINVGLAHVLAASGFHVSLLLGLILKVTNGFSSKSQLTIGLITLLGYMGLTGLQPSVFRATLMGTAVLMAIALDTKVKPLGSLLLAATIILLVNPLFIADLGFQLSFLATFGLIVTLPALQAKLDWLPSTIATAIAIPVAASIWVLPLLSYVFNTVATYSILVNIICTPLVMVVSLGGMVSAIASLIIPSIGSAIAWLLFYPTGILVGIVDFFTNLPGNSWAIGKIPLVLLLAVYGLLGLLWLNKWWQQRWWLVLLLALGLIVIPIGYGQLNLVRVTVLAANKEQVVVVQDKGQVILINSGAEDTNKYTLVPFLQQQGINRLDYAIALDNRSNSVAGWLNIDHNFAIANFINNAETTFIPSLEKKSDEAIITHSSAIDINNLLSVLQLKIQEQTWLILGDKETEINNLQEYIRSNKNLNPLVIFWSGNNLNLEWLKTYPKIAIATNSKISEDIKKELDKQQIKLYNTQQHGAIQWTPQNGFVTFISR